MNAPQLPSGWRWARFHEVARIASNLVDPRLTPDATHIAPNHIEPRSGQLIGRGTVQADDVKSSKHAFRPGQILYSKIRPYLAKAVLVDFPGVCSADMYPIDVRPDVMDAEFLLAWMLTPEFTEAASGRQGRTVLPKINQDALNELRVPVPPLADQKCIAARLKALRARSKRAKEALDAVPALLERLRQSILAAAFRGDLTADWREQNPDVEPASELLKRIRAERRKRWEEAQLAKMLAKGKPPKDDRWKAKYVEPEPVDETDLPELPDGWCWASIDIVGDLLLGRRRAEREYVAGRDGRSLHPYVRVANVKDDRFDFSDLLQMPFSDQEVELYRLRPGDIVLSEGQSLDKVGQSALYRGGGPHDLCIQATVHRFRGYTGVNPECAQLLFMHYVRSGIFRQSAAITTNIAHLTSERLRPIPFILPPVAEQRELARRARKLLDGVTHLAALSTAAATELKALDEATLAAAFRGELLEARREVDAATHMASP